MTVRAGYKYYCGCEMQACFRSFSSQLKIRLLCTDRIFRSST